MKLVNNNISRNVYKKMGMLDSENLYNDSDYIGKYFSVFDHKLSTEEAEKLMMFYDQEDARKQRLLYEQYCINENKFLEFYIDLFSIVQVYGVLYDESNTSKIIEYDSIEEYKSHVILSIREQLFLKIVIPQFYSVIKGNYDLTHILLTKKDYPEGLEAISKIVKAHELFILE